MNAAALAGFIERHAPVVVVTGAGCSTGSGIGDYRGAEGRFKRAAPIQHRDFMRLPDARRRYWARSIHGWPAFAAARPNDAHRALALLEASGRVSTLVTRNVDGLHQAAGSTRVIELHGWLHRVVCMLRTAPTR